MALVYTGASELKPEPSQYLPPVTCWTETLTSATPEATPPVVESLAVPQMSPPTVVQPPSKAPLLYEPALTGKVMTVFGAVRSIVYD